MLPEGWKSAFIRSCVEIGRGFAFKTEQYQDAGYPVLRVSNIGDNGNISNDKNWKFISYADAKNYKNYQLKEDDILLVMVGATTGKMGRVRKENLPALLNQNMWVLRGKEKDGLEQGYFSYIAHRVVENFLSSQQGSARGFLRQSDFSKEKIILPPLPEQKKIAATLSTWDRAIEGTEKLLANSQQQKKALMQQLLTGKKRLPGFTGEWRNTSLYEICTLNPKSPKIEELTQISFIPMDGVSNDARISDVTIRAFKKENNGFSYFQEKDVLVAKITPCFENGKGGYLNELPTQHGFGSTEFHVLRATANADGKFIYYIATSERFRILGEMNMQGSAGQKRVPKDFIERFSVNFPPLPEQKAIAAVLTTADEEITALEGDLSRLRQEKKALMQQLLTGKRRVRVN
ncbi:restriction endonuclease subunit S [Acetobacter thailandicus]|uniref:restriction endonuclease subunit S n=1 Tax=Acetobacter thailandicus TaxID=1502842 RepID=UPI001BAA9771|nr:restriction endonuclease subunit S [Acetobacter thailandicus]MBS1004609.1 restriction endonuclease subunit S [Acetobacter thailandicus]